MMKIAILLLLLICFPYLFSWLFGTPLAATIMIWFAIVIAGFHATDWFSG